MFYQDDGNVDSGPVSDDSQKIGYGIIKSVGTNNRDGDYAGK